MDINRDLIGLCAGMLTTVSFIPQLIKIYRTKCAGDISISMYMVFIAGVTLWLVYGVMLESVPVIAANAVTLSLCFIIIFMKIIYGRSRT